MAGEVEESSYIVAKLLNCLKEVYTFKELEEALGVSSQILWRYTTFTQFPERQTARKILDGIREKRLLERAFKEMVIGERKTVEEWRFLFNPRFLNLVGYLAWKKFRDDGVDVVLAAGEKNAALAAILAEWLSAESYVASEHAWSSWGKLYSASYSSSEREEIVYLHVPREALKRDSKVLFAKGVARNFESLAALRSIAEQAKAVPVGAVVAVSLSGEWMGLAEKAGLRKVYVASVVADGNVFVNLP
ncbi:hypothetical protein [Thermofilum pendens]|uniref:Uncharacterized protein n=1 Tax=Thermofilum pendens (strain DSM 2475 / Hrk 5) TaxID=368408 RepID=A1RZZ7_THEPD|nr:hypothetical protein [Thermofilum pendens]ABL78777.1 hypothetical protein Tpen_1380 [Thermofilum pendens Hrk 5]